MARYPMVVDNINTREGTMARNQEEAWNLARQLIGQLPADLQGSLDAIDALTQMVHFCSDHGGSKNLSYGTSSSFIGTG